MKVILFTVRFFPFSREVFLFCREAFPFWPWGSSFCREYFSFAEKLFLLPWQLWATVVFLIGSEYLPHLLDQSDAEFRNQLVACVFPCMTPATFTQGSYVPVLWFFSFLSVAMITWGLVIRHSTGEKWHSESSTSM